MALFDKDSLIGCRVVKELDSKWIKQNGVKGQLGTVREALSFENYSILWDNGICDHSLSSSLRVFDSGPSGLKDQGVDCTFCKSNPIIGIVWQCSECVNVSLCTICYHNDKHNLRHRFHRVLVNVEAKTLMDSRKKSKKIRLKGILPNSKVDRGLDWQWGDQDGGEGKRGIVTEIKDWKSSHPRSGVYIYWHNKAGIYRLGFEGKCDVKTVVNCKGVPVYFDHLPFLSDFHMPFLKSQSNLPKHENWLNNVFECLRIGGPNIDQEEDFNHVNQIDNSMNDISIVDNQSVSLKHNHSLNLNSTLKDSLPSTSFSFNSVLNESNNLIRNETQFTTDCNEKVIASVMDVYQSLDLFNTSENENSSLYQIKYPKTNYISVGENAANNSYKPANQEVVDLCGTPWMYTLIDKKPASESHIENNSEIIERKNISTVESLDQNLNSFISLPSKTCVKPRHLSNKINPKIHSQIDYIHHLVPDLWSITNCGYYWGKMNRYEADKLLENKPEGTFLLRDSTQEEHLFSVSFRRFDHSIHARVEQFDHRFSFYSHDPTASFSSTICGLIEQYTFKDPRQCRYFEPMLTNRLNRNFVFSLQHLARARICSTIKYDLIDDLELPFTLRNFLKEYHYKQKVRVKSFDDVL